MKRVIAVSLMALAMLAAAAGTAEAGSAPTRLTFTAPGRATLSELVTMRARLVDAQGAPIARARIAFVAPLTFLNGGGDVVLAESLTDKDGSAVGTFQARVAGALALRAVFRGDDLYASSEARADLTVAGDEHPLYAEHVGVHLPGLNQPPGIGQVALSEPQETIISRALALWPAMSGWPIAAALIVIWSIYAGVVRLLFRIAAPPTAGSAAVGSIAVASPPAGASR